MTIQEKIADYRRKAQNGSLPPSAKAKFLQLADELESQLQANKNDAAPDYDKLLHKDKAPKRKSSGQTKKAAKADNKPKAKPAPKAKRAPKEKTRRTKPADTGSKVDRTDMSAKFVSEFVKLLDKSVRGTRLVSYLKRLQKAILDQQVRKKSKYADLIEIIQTKLVRLLNSENRISSTVISLTPESKAKFADFFADNNYTSAKLLKEYISLQDNYVSFKKANSLLARMEKALKDGRIGASDPFKSQVVAACSKLAKIDENERLDFSASELRGLGSLLK
jgi:hypothetical protein